MAAARAAAARIAAAAANLAADRQAIRDTETDLWSFDRGVGPQGHNAYVRAIQTPSERVGRQLTITGTREWAASDCVVPVALVNAAIDAQRDLLTAASGQAPRALFRAPHQDERSSATFPHSKALQRLFDASRSLTEKLEFLRALDREAAEEQRDIARASRPDKGKLKAKLAKRNKGKASRKSGRHGQLPGGANKRSPHVPLDRRSPVLSPGEGIASATRRRVDKSVPAAGVTSYEA